jgi:hypothetical protein
MRLLPAIKRLLLLVILLKAGLFLFRDAIPGTVYFYTKAACDWILLLSILAWSFSPLRGQLFVEGKFSLASIKTKTASRVLLSVAFCAVVLAGLQVFIHTFSLTRMALNDLSHSPQGAQVLGQPIRTGWFITFRIRGGDSWTADLSIPVSGPKNSADLTVQAEKVNQVWKMAKLSLLCDRCDKAVEVEH